MQYCNAFATLQHALMWAVGELPCNPAGRAGLGLRVWVPQPGSAAGSSYGSGQGLEIYSVFLIWK